MVVLNGKFDGNRVILDLPVPSDIPANTPVRVIFHKPGEDDSDALAKIAAMAVSADLPSDFSQQHDHYVKGTPRR